MRGKTPISPNADPLVRFNARLRIDSDTGCWVWFGGRTSRGYGHFRVDGRYATTHRWAYEHLVGPIPEGLEIDHLCRNHSCANPAHLEPVTHKENVLRGRAPTAINAAKTHCTRGHEFVPSNIIWRDGRHCKACRRVDNREYMRRVRAAVR